MISTVNYKILYSQYKDGKLNGIDIPGKGRKKIYQIGKSLKFDRIIDKIIQLIDRVLSALPMNLQPEWPKRQLEIRTKKVLSNFNKTVIDKLPANVKTQSGRLLNSYFNATDFALLPFDSLTAVKAGKSVPNLLEDEFFDILKSNVFPRLDTLSKQNFFDVQLPLLPPGNNHAPSMYLDLVKRRVFKLKLAPLIAAVRFCGKKIKTLNLSPLSKVLTNEDLNAICSSCPNLKSLKLDRCKKITNEGTKYLSQLSKLNELSIAECTGIKDKGFKQLSKLNKLSKLNVSGCGKGCSYDTWISFLNKLTNLTDLNISNYKFNPRDKADFTVSDLWNPWEVKMAFDTISDLKAPKRLRKLNISGGGNSFSKGLPSIKRFTNLIELEMKKCHISMKATSNLSTLNKLKKLNMSGCQKILFSFSTLNEPDWIGECFDDDLKFVSKLSKLTELNISEMRYISNHTLENLCISNRKLKKINIRNSGIHLHDKKLNDNFVLRRFVDGLTIIE